MKKILTVYFDYACPYCFRGITNLLELLPEFPELSIDWVPCEAHPKPERAFVHSDVASQAMMAAAAQGCDLIQFNQKVLAAHFTERRRIDHPDVLADIAADLSADRAQILAALKNGVYKAAVLRNNRLVWDTMQLEAVPCYKSGSKLLASQEDTAILKGQLKSFLSSAVNDESYT